jgi:hypothetical protein
MADIVADSVQSRFARGGNTPASGSYRSRTGVASSSSSSSSFGSFRRPSVRPTVVLARLFPALASCVRVSFATPGSFSSGELSGEPGGESAPENAIVAITSTCSLPVRFCRSVGTTGGGGGGATFFSNTEGVFTLYAGPGTCAPVLWVRDGIGEWRAEVGR